MLHLLTSAPPPSPPLLLLRLDYSTHGAPRLSPLSRSALRQSASLTRRTSRFGPASSFLPSHCACCCCCCCLVSTYADERRRHIPPSLLLEGRFQFAFTFLLAGSIGFRAVPVNSPPFPSPELSSNSSETSGRRRVLDSPSPPPARLGSLLWKLVQSQSSCVSKGKKEGFDGRSGEDVGPCCL